ncbi:MAG: recombinase family protein, partial [Chloroflexi bacterium]|nr:recombinase family protein [Chloroflexota bacterium]
MRAVGYFRPASEPGGADEAEGALSGQASAPGAIERYCRENFHQLARVVEASGPAGRYDELIGFFRGTRTAALVLIPDSTHLADDLPTLVERLIELEEAGGEVRCVDRDLPDPLQSGLASLGLRGRAPERLRRVREAIGAKAVRGEVLGRTPYGYRAGLDGRLTPHPDEAETVRCIFRWYAGDGEEAAGERPAYRGPGLRRIAARLDDEGVRTRSGNPWTPVAVAGVLRNRVYVGTYSRLGLRLVGSHAGLVDRALFNRAQEIVRHRRPRRRRARPGRYLLGGLLRCGVCGPGVFGQTRRRT